MDMGLGHFLLGAAAYKLLVADGNKAGEAHLREAEETRQVLRELARDTERHDMPENPIEVRPRILFPNG
jgi:hypothetical protein